jgi:hypothetical protein
MAPPLTGLVDFSDLASARHCPEQLERRTVLQNRLPGQQLTRALGGTRRAVASHSLGKTSRPQPIDQIDMVRFDIYASRYKNASKQSASPPPEAAPFPKSLARNHKRNHRIGSPVPLSTARSGGFGMDDRVIDILAALCVAAVAAVVAWFLAQYVFGVSSRDIRISALTGAAIFALLMAPVWFGKKFK